MVFLSFAHTNADTWKIPEPAHIWEPTCTLIPVKLDTYWSMFRRFWIMEFPWTGLKSWVISIALAMPRKLLVQFQRCWGMLSLMKEDKPKFPCHENPMFYTHYHTVMLKLKGCQPEGWLFFFFFGIFSQNTAIFLPYSSTYTCINLLHQCLHHGGSQGYKNCQLLFIPLIAL